MRLNGFTEPSLYLHEQVVQGIAMQAGNERALEKAQVVWVQGHQKRRNQFARFTRRFSVKNVPTHFPLYVFADTRYRLRVNGVFVATGPSRFVTANPEHDHHELSPYLIVGDNRIEVEVNFYGASSYQTMPDGEPGFIAAGGTHAVSLDTPGAWEACVLTAWRWDAPTFSFAQGPVEICDTRRLDEVIPSPLVAVSGKNAPWGRLSLYRGPKIPFIPHRPRSLELVGPLRDSEYRIGFMVQRPEAHAKEAQSAVWTAFATWIYSPCEQTHTFSAFWSEITLNGDHVLLDTQSELGNHGRLRLKLRPGWNLLVGAIEVLAEFWPYCLGIPRQANVSLHARQDRRCHEPLALAPISRREHLVLPLPGATEPPAGWKPNAGNILDITPARMVSWDKPASGALRKLDPARLDETGAMEEHAATWCFSFSGEFMGHIVAEVEGPAGTVVDIACDDWQRGDGAVALYRSNPFTDAADRYVLRGGRQMLEGFHVRGGKLIQVTMRAPEHLTTARLSLIDLWVRSRQTLGPDQTAFTCDLPEVQWAWPVALRTLRVSTDEAYTDCPWRERGSYIGDTLVALNLHALYSPDLRVAARVLRQFGEAQLPNGQLPCCAPSWLRKPHEDFTLLWLLALHDYVKLTGDLSLVHAAWPVIERIWDSPSWHRHESGLWNADHHRLFIDWGVRPEERAGQANAVLNILRVAAGRACAGLARAINRNHIPFLDDAESTHRAVLTHLWHGAENRLRASYDANTPALHANILALAFELGTREQRSLVLSYVEPLLKNNLTRGIRLGDFSGHLELFYLFFALPAMARNHRPDIAEQLIKDHYGYLMKHGDDTFPECFSRLKQAGGSRCHSWSGAAAIYAARYIAGCRPMDDREFGHMILDPVVHGIQRASCRIAHPSGWIHIAWERSGNTFEAEIEHPPEVCIHPAPSVQLVIPA